MKNAPLHRDAGGDIATFAVRFVNARMAGLEKDLRICLTPIPSTSRAGMTHAYFPALAACCGTLEYLVGLHRGNTRGIGWQQLSAWGQDFLPQPDYSPEATKLLFEALRHPVAHRGIASGVWVDPHPGAGGTRRVTWKISADARRPACDVLDRAGQLVKDSPWPCAYSHRVHIHLRALWIDIRNAAKRYCAQLPTDVQLQQRFESAMRQLYPA